VLTRINNVSVMRKKVRSISPPVHLSMYKGSAPSPVTSLRKTL
jgi:hypothetical protein